MGAVSTCPSCGAVFNLNAENTTKQDMLAVPSPVAAEQLLKESKQQNFQQAKAAKRVENARDLTGLSGLSQLVAQAEPPRESQTKLQAAPGPHAEPEVGEGLMVAQTEIAAAFDTLDTPTRPKRRSKRKRGKASRRASNQKLAVLLTLGCVVTAIALVTIYLLREELGIGRFAAPPAQVEEEPDDPTRDGTISEDGLRKHGEPDFFGM